MTTRKRFRFLERQRPTRRPAHGRRAERPILKDAADIAALQRAGQPPAHRGERVQVRGHPHPHLLRRRRALAARRAEQARMGKRRRRGGTHTLPIGRERPHLHRQRA